MMSWKNVISWLVKQGADIEAVDAEGRTALILAARHKREEAVKVLLALRADMDKKDFQGHDAYFYAEEDGDPGIIRLLREARKGEQ